MFITTTKNVVTFLQQNSQNSLTSIKQPIYVCTRISIRSVDAAGALLTGVSIAKAMVTCQTLRKQKKVGKVTKLKWTFPPFSRIFIIVHFTSLYVKLVKLNA